VKRYDMHLIKELDLELVDVFVEILGEFSGVNEGDSRVDTLEFSGESGDGGSVSFGGGIPVSIFGIEGSVILLKITLSLAKELFIGGDVV
jgi:hypothetical protein